jgi:hypothetical protein
VSLVTVRGRPHSPGVGALVREAMRSRWLGRTALAVETEQGAEETGRKPVGEATRSPVRARQAPPDSPPRRFPDQNP